MNLHHVTRGQGPNVLLISGLNGKARFWDPVVEQLSARFRLLAFDQRGCGATADDGADWTIETLAEDARMVADRVFGEAPFAVVGHSTGGAIAQALASRHPARIRALVLSGTWLRADAYMSALFNLRLSLLERAPDLDPILSFLLRMPPETYAAPDADVVLDPDVTRRRVRALLAHDGAEFAPTIAQPTLVIGAADDRIVPIHLCRALGSALPIAEPAVLGDGGHFFPQTRTEAFCAHLSAWFDNPRKMPRVGAPTVPDRDA